MADKYANKARLERREHRAERCHEKCSFPNEANQKGSEPLSVA